jgi:hypothetical protein
MKNIILTFILCISSLAFAQEQPAPPLKISQESKIQIDNLIESTGIKEYFYSYCRDKVEIAAILGKWNEQKKQIIIDSINYKDFEFQATSAFANFNKQELEDLSLIFKKINTNKKIFIKIIPMNKILQIHFDTYIKNLIEGKFTK